MKTKKFRKHHNRRRKKTTRIRKKSRILSRKTKKFRGEKPYNRSNHKMRKKRKIGGGIWPFRTGNPSTDETCVKKIAANSTGRLYKLYSANTYEISKNFHNNENGMLVKNRSLQRANKFQDPKREKWFVVFRPVKPQRNDTNTDWNNNHLSIDETAKIKSHMDGALSAANAVRRVEVKDLDTGEALHPDEVEGQDPDDVDGQDPDDVDGPEVANAVQEYTDRIVMPLFKYSDETASGLEKQQITWRQEEHPKQYRNTINNNWSNYEKGLRESPTISYCTKDKKSPTEEITLTNDNIILNLNAQCFFIGPNLASGSKAHWENCKLIIANEKNTLCKLITDVLQTEKNYNRAIINSINAFNGYKTLSVTDAEKKKLDEIENQIKLGDYGGANPTRSDVRSLWSDPPTTRARSPP